MRAPEASGNWIGASPDFAQSALEFDASSHRFLVV